MTEHTPYNGNAVHRKWVEWGWFRVVLEDARAGDASKRARRERAERRALAERAALAARRRALGVQSMNLVW